MAPNKTSVLIVAAVASLYILRVQGKPYCPPCSLDDTCEPEVKKCEYEEIKDYCGQKACSKGPGERCGGAYNVHGICADGLYCECNKCRGCTIKGLNCSKGVALLCYIT